MRESYYNQVKAAIRNMKSGTVLSIADFCAVAIPKTVSKMLTRLSEDGVIEKVLRSIFWIPDGVHRSPHPDAVARAIARENNWTLSPSGETALHLSGLSDERPGVWTYQTDGTYREYDFDGKHISFTHTGKMAMKALSEKTRLLVQCIRAIGKEHLNDDVLRRIAKLFGAAQLQSLAAETHELAAWVRRAVARMIRLAPARAESEEALIKAQIKR